MRRLAETSQLTSVGKPTLLTQRGYPCSVLLARASRHHRLLEHGYSERTSWLADVAVFVRSQFAGIGWD
jgi:hypothetical protein